MKTGGLALGGGFKSVYYTNPGKKSDGVTDKPKQDTIVFIMLGAGGAF
jgi:hypothetical protein